MRRVRQSSIPLPGKRRLEVKLRNFRTNPKRRSQKNKHVVVGLGRLLPFKEAAFIISRRPQRRRTNRQRYSMSLTALVLLAGLAGTIFFASLSDNAQLSGPPQEIVRIPAPTTTTAPLTDTSDITASVPLRLRLPAVGIDAPLMTVGLAEDKTLETPPLHQNIAGWYEHSPTPGEVGPSIIVGHVDSYTGPSVFYRLADSEPGDDIVVTRQDGSKLHFIVTKVTQVDKAKFPTEDVYGNIEHPGLRLITCGGTYSATTDSYSHNTVVYAKLNTEKIED